MTLDEFVAKWEQEDWMALAREAYEANEERERLREAAKSVVDDHRKDRIDEWDEENGTTYTYCQADGLDWPCPDERLRQALTPTPTTDGSSE